ncbi:carboxymuconolactone decarboxylase family protein [Planococcus salinus]|nr:carboxymuconolactone decarboxylase family protein [Planococcus salinus]
MADEKTTQNPLSDWAQKMNAYSPKAWEHYRALQDEVLAAGALSRKDKELILVGINAARRYESGMLQHAENALKEGATVQEFVEVLSVCILSRGIPAWLEGIKAIEYAIEHSDETNASPQEKTEPQEAVAYFKQENNGLLPEWARIMNDYSPVSLARYAALRQSELTDAAVSRKLKELVLVGINLAERYDKGVQLHINGARKEGATEQEIAEVGLISVLTAGIPAWFEVSGELG